MVTESMEAVEGMEGIGEIDNRGIDIETCGGFDKLGIWLRAFLHG